MLKKLRTHPRRPLPNNPCARRRRWDQLWSLPGYLNRKFEHGPYCCEVCFPALDKWSKAAACKCVLSYARRLTRTQLISRNIMGDESWIYGYEPETKQQSSQWSSPQLWKAKKARQVPSSTKSMLIVFQCEGDCSSWICSS
jgi:hypothetical protein